jgi:hypothetical protein
MAKKLTLECRPLTLHEVLTEEDFYLDTGVPEPVAPKWGLTAAEILHPTELAELLRTDNRPLVVWLREQQGQAWAQRSDLPDPELPDRLCGGLNAVLNSGSSILDPARFAGVQVPAEVRELADLGPQGTDLLYLNRRLLDAAFPDQLRAVDESHLAGLWDRLATADSGRAALCLSGGGIRSATFSLGVLQGLAREKLLDRFTYLSTVSGGGYIGSWLTAWIKRRGRGCVMKELSDLLGSRIEPEQEPIRYLRNYTNYLTPRTGSLSADTWAIVATYLRNTLLNWLVLLPLLMFLVLIPRCVVALVRPTETGPSPTRMALLGALAALLAIVTVAYVHSTRPSLLAEGRPVPPLVLRIRSLRGFVWLCLAPILAATTLFGMVFGQLNAGRTPIETVADWTGLPVGGRGSFLLLPLLGTLIHLLGWLLSLLLLRRTPPPKHLREYAEGLCGHRFGGPVAVVAEPAVIAATGFVPGFIAFGLVRAVGTASPDPLRVLLYACLGPPLLLVLLLVAGMLFTGLASRWVDDGDREWGARFGGFILAAALAWTLWTGLIVFGPVAVVSGKKIAAGLASIGGFSGLFSLLAGKSPLTRAVADPAHPGQGSRLPDIPLGALAALFFAVVLVFASYGVNEFMPLLGNLLSKFTGAPPVIGGWDPPAWQSPFSDASPQQVQLLIVRHTPVLLLLAIGVLLAAFLVAGFIDLNQFSLHAMYRARLIRAYLGASRKVAERAPNPFTGFDEGDNLWMKDLVESAGTGPVRLFHVLNLTLNLTQTDRLSWQERKAASFTVSPLHAGSWAVAYRPIGGPDLQRRYGGDAGITLGTAAAISGAAASPNMGYHSSPLVALLMTVFNARLGWWLGNPGAAGNSTWYLPRATGGFRRMVDEACGRTNARRKFVYLSDGGHFDNLGLYEMVLRRCRLIFVIDASADPAFHFSELGMAIRNVRIDLGVPIAFDERPRIRRRDTEQGSYWAVATIKYSEVTEGAKDGILVYLKPTLYGCEPEDVRAYAASHITFPHESTTDQWFSESQFESYRSLGTYIIGETIQQLRQRAEPKEGSTTLGDFLRGPVG